MFQVQGSSEPDPLLSTLEKYVFASLRELVSIVQNKTIYEYVVGSVCLFVFLFVSSLVSEISFSVVLR